jgi:hypothetical protein
MLRLPFHAPSEEDAMEKIQLKLESLRVETFETAERPQERGTVDAHQIGSQLANCTNTTCPPYNCFCTENLSCRCQ